MRTSRKRVLAACVLILAMATVVAAWSAEAQTPPFSSTPVAGTSLRLPGHQSSSHQGWIGFPVS